MSDLGLKVSFTISNFFKDIVTLGYTYQLRLMALASTVFKKSTFQNFPHFNALGSTFDKVNLGS